MADEIEFGLLFIVVFATIICFLLTWSIGANDVANTFGTSVGAKVLTIRQACIIAAIFEFLGAFLMGSHVANTFKDKLLFSNLWEDDPSILAVGMTSSMIGAFVLITIATFFSLPVSGTHAILGAVIGFAIISRGIYSVQWMETVFIIGGWLLSPILAGLTAFIMYFGLRKIILRSRNSFYKGVQFIPICYGVTISLVALFILYKGSAGLDLSFIPTWLILVFVVLLGISTGIIIWIFSPTIEHLAIKRAGIDHNLNVPYQIPSCSKYTIADNTDVEMDELEDNNDNNNNNISNNSDIEENITNKSNVNFTENNKDIIIIKDNEDNEIHKKDNHNEINENDIDNIDNINNINNIDNIDNNIKKNQKEDDEQDKSQDINNNNEEIGIEIEILDDENDIKDFALISEEFDPRTEQLFSLGQILMAVVGSFAHGANDIANAIGPFAVVISIYNTGVVNSEGSVPWWILVMGGVGIVTGLAMWGYKVIQTIGEKLTKVTPSRGFNIELGSAITVMGASRLGIPLSTTHCKVGAVVGVGLADGGRAVQWKMVANVAFGWVVTLPVAAVVSAVVFIFLTGIGDYSK